MSLRSAMHKAAGLFVELSPEDEPSSTLKRSEETSDDDDSLNPGSNSGPYASPRIVEDIVRDAEKQNTEEPNLDDIDVEEHQSGVPLPSFVSSDRLDFAAIYQAAKLPAVSFGAEQMLEAINGLPADLPLETRRSTVRSLLGTLGKSLGATPESVVADASRKLAALNSFAGYMERKTSDSVTLFEKEIADLQSQIEARRAGIEAARAEMASVTQGCETESHKLNDVLEFFSLNPQHSQNPAPGEGEAL